MLRMIRHPSSFPARSLRVLALSLLLIGALTGSPLAIADPAAEVHQHCGVSDRAQARWLGDALFEQGAYQRAGECYQAAGEYALADRAFLKAVGPQSAVTARELTGQRDQAKGLLRQVKQAFRVDH
jgi:hypothetical protein